MKLSAITAQIRDEVTTIVPFDELERQHIADVLSWIDSGANLFRIEKPDKPPKHLVSYFERREFNDMTWFTFGEILQSHPAILDPHMQRFTCKHIQYLDT